MFYESRRIKHWWTTTVAKNGVVQDAIIISYENDNLMTYVSFKRLSVYCFDDELEEYVESKVPDIRFVTLLYQLTKYAQRCYLTKKAA